MNDKERTVAVLIAVAVFFGGYLLGGQRHGIASERVSEAAAKGTHRHMDHGTIDVSDDPAIPRVDLTIHKDAMSGRNLEIVTENFRFAPEHASTEHVVGEGHAHLYVDGKKIARAYGRWFHIAEPAPGTHSIRVTLNSNAHQDFTVGGRVVEAVETLSVPSP